MLAILKNGGNPFTASYPSQAAQTVVEDKY